MSQTPHSVLERLLGLRLRFCIKYKAFKNNMGAYRVHNVHIAYSKLNIVCIVYHRSSNKKRITP